MGLLVSDKIFFFKFPLYKSTRAIDPQGVCDQFEPHELLDWQDLCRGHMLNIKAVGLMVSEDFKTLKVFLL